MNPDEMVRMILNTTDRQARFTAAEHLYQAIEDGEMPSQHVEMRATSWGDMIFPPMRKTDFWQRFAVRSMSVPDGVRVAELLEHPDSNVTITDARASGSA